jgi:ATP-binding cassette subfamily D (ALD) protein 3
MPSVLSKITTYATPKTTAALSTGVIMLYLVRMRNKKRVNRVKDLRITLKDGVKKEEKAAVDLQFFQRLGRLIRILVPGFLSSESAYMALVAIMLIIRTYCDVWMIQNGTAIESAIVGRNMQLFKSHLYKFILSMPSIALINNLLKFGLSELKLRFRTRLTNHLYEKYLRGFTYYQMSNLDSRISNADQLLTQDVEKFCDCVAELYSNLSKPILDIIIYSIKLTSTIGAQGPGYMFLYLVGSGLILTRLRRPLGRMTMVEQQCEGEYRFVNSRLITNSEEIAFYQGNVKEISIMHSTFNKLVDHLRSLINFRFQMGMVDTVIGKYIATVVGYLVVSRPFMNLSSTRLLNS